VPWKFWKRRRNPKSVSRGTLRCFKKYVNGLMKRPEKRPLLSWKNPNPAFDNLE
jgi:hypothetical protein